MSTNLMLVVLAAALAIPCWLTMQGEKMDVTSLASIPVMFPGFTPDKVATVELMKRKSKEELEAAARAAGVPVEKLPAEQQFEALVFQRAGEDWQLVNTELAGLKVPRARIDDAVLIHFRDIKTNEENKIGRGVDEKFRGENGLTPETGTMLRCRAVPSGPQDPGRSLGELIVGGSTKRGKVGEAGAIDGFYVVRADKLNDVVLYEPKDKSWHLPLRASEWVDTTVHSFLMSEVEAFYFRNAFGNAGFTKKPGSTQTWVAVPEQCSPKNVGAVRQGKVTDLVNHFLVVKAERFDPKRPRVQADEVWNKGVVEVRCKLRSGEEHIIWVQKRNDDTADSWVFGTGCKFKFALSNFKVGPFRTQNPEELFDPK